MNIKDALDFLTAHQPMPDYPPESLLTRYRAVTALLYDQPDARAVPLLLGSFAVWEDMTVYDSVQAVLRRFPTHTVVPHLRRYLDSPHETVRSWCADTARYFPDPSLVAPLTRLLRELDPNTRMAAATGLEAIRVPGVVNIAREALVLETDEDVCAVLQDIVARDEDDAL